MMIGLGGHEILRLRAIQPPVAARIKFTIAGIYVESRGVEYNRGHNEVQIRNGTAETFATENLEQVAVGLQFMRDLLSLYVQEAATWR